jgi:hypothetical protein
MSPSKFLLAKSHKINAEIFQSKITGTWRLGHPRFVPFQLGQHVLMKIQHKGFLNLNKFEAHFKGPMQVVKVNDNGLTYQVIDSATGQTI